MLGTKTNKKKLVLITQTGVLDEALVKKLEDAGFRDFKTRSKEELLGVLQGFDVKSEEVVSKAVGRMAVRTSGWQGTTTGGPARLQASNIFIRSLPTHVEQFREMPKKTEQEFNGSARRLTGAQGNLPDAHLYFADFLHALPQALVHLG